MAAAAFVVAFAHKAKNETGESLHDAAMHLRDLLDAALDINDQLFSHSMFVSVAPAGVMFALLDSSPDRAIALCQAVSSQLEHQARTQYTMPAVCAVITHGSLRFLDVLGFSTNFEGLPAITAARVLAKLSPGELAVEASAFKFPHLQKQCGEIRELRGKLHDAAMFQVRIHQRIQFPTKPREETVEVTAEKTLPDAPLPVQLAPYEAFAQEVREHIKDVLQEPSMQGVRAAISKEGGGNAAEDVLVPTQPQPGVLLAAMDSLYHATKRYVPVLTKQPPDIQKTIKQAIKEILGWQVLLVVNRGHLQTNHLAFDPRPGGLNTEIPVRLEVGVEVLVSSLRSQAAAFVLKVSVHQPARVVGRDSMLANIPEDGLVYHDHLQGLLKHIWGQVMKPDPIPLSFGADELGHLQAGLAGRERLNKNCFYITVPKDQTHPLRVDKELLRRLQEALPLLRIIHLSDTEDTEILLLNEFTLHHSILALLRLLQDAGTLDPMGATS